MAITILPPSDSPSSSRSPSPSPSTDSEPSSPPPANQPRPAKKPKISHTSILVPGDLITTEPQWMRGHGTFIPTSPLTDSGPAELPATGQTIRATLPGPLTLTNKLLSITPLRTRYHPSIGDLVIGRIVTVDKARWRVDIGAPLTAHLPLSSINLPGGVLRRRTTADELQIRNYFQEGDLVVAEVQMVGGSDGVAGLHTRSLRYGKLRNGVFVRVGGRGVQRGKRQVFTLRVANGGGEVDVALGVNGFVWVSQHVSPDEEAGLGLGTGMSGKGPTAGAAAATRGGSVSVSNLDEMVSNEIYSSQNDEIGPATRREMARLCECVPLLAGAGISVDEDTVTRAYRAAVEEEMETMVDEDGEIDADLRSQRDKSVIRAVMRRGSGDYSNALDG